MGEGPFERKMKVSESGGKLSAEVVEGCGGMEVGAGGARQLISPWVDKIVER